MGRELPVSDGSEAWVFASDLVAGGVAGVAADTVMHPVDTIKARMQATRAKGRHPSMQGSMFTIFRRIVVQEGVTRGLYAGFGAVLAGTIPTHAIMFASYKSLKRAAETAIANDSALPYADFACAAGCELFALAPYVPAEVVAKRMQIAALGSSRNYKSTAHAVRVIHEREGIRGLYAGLWPTMLRDVPFTAIQFSLFTAGKDLHHRVTNRSSLTNTEATVLGFIVGTIGAAATNPADVVKTRLQTQASGAHGKYKGVLHCFERIFLEEGMAGFARGIVPRMVWVAPASAITLSVYEAVSRSLRPL